MEWTLSCAESSTKSVTCLVQRWKINTGNAGYAAVGFPRKSFNKCSLQLTLCRYTVNTERALQHNDWSDRPEQQTSVTKQHKPARKSEIVPIYSTTKKKTTTTTLTFKLAIGWPYTWRTEFPFNRLAWQLVIPTSSTRFQRGGARGCHLGLSGSWMILLLANRGMAREATILKCCLNVYRMKRFSSVKDKLLGVGKCISIISIHINLHLKNM